MALQVKVVLAPTYTHRLVNVSCDQKIFAVPVPRSGHTFTDLVTQITVDKQYLKLVQTLSKSVDSLPIKEYYRLREQAAQYFGVELNLDFDDWALQLMSEGEKIMSDMEELTAKDLLAVCRNAFNHFKTPVLLAKISRKLKRYISITSRNQKEKDQLNVLVSFVKDLEINERAQPQQASSSPQVQKPQPSKDIIQEGVLSKDESKITKKRPKKNKKEQVEDFINHEQEQSNDNDWIDVQEKKRKGSNKQEQKGSSKSIILAAKQAPFVNQFDSKNSSRLKSKNQKYTDNQNINKSRDSDWRGSTSKQRTSNKPKEPRVILGINGDTDAGWRLRNRPIKIAKTDPEASNNEKKVKPVIVKAAVEKREASQATEAGSAENGSTRLVFSCPRDGKKYKFFAGRSYDLYVNNLFWVNIKPDHIVIQKDGKGFIRNSKVDFDDDQTGLMADGIVISMNSACNLEDGGLVFGNPDFNQFLPNGKQHFILTSLDVYEKPF